MNRQAAWSLPIVAALVSCTRAEAPAPPARSSEPASRATAQTMHQRAATASPPDQQAPSALVFPEHQRVAVGAGHSCYVNMRGRLWCWGGNSSGAIGNGTHAWRGRSEDTDESALYVKEPYSGYQLPAIRSVGAAGGRTCVVTKEGDPWCWGMDENAAGGLSDVLRPRTLPGKAVAVSGCACALLEDRTLWCWTDRGRRRTLDPSLPNYVRAQRVKAVGNQVLRVASAAGSTCVIKQDRSVWCWGDNDYGKLTREKPKFSSVPLATPVRGVDLITAGMDHFCAASKEGAIWCWGQAIYGQLGNGKRPYQPGAPPVATKLDVTLVQLASTFASSHALDSNGRVWSWGSNLHSTLGLPSAQDIESPTRIDSIDHVVQLAEGETHICALRSDETVWCWGRGRDFQLGNGKDVDSRVPVQVKFPAP